MGEHKGWFVYELGDGKWRGAYRLNGKYVTMSWGKPADARKWAAAEAAKVRAQQIAGRLPRAPITSCRTVDLANDFMFELHAIGRTEGHLRDVKHMMEQAAKVCPDLAAPDAGDLISAWLSTLKTNGGGRGGKIAAVSPSRRNKYRVMLRGLCQWGIRHRRLAEDPTALIRSAKVPHYLRPQLSLDECRTLVDYGATTSTRSWRWCMLMLYAGLRAREAHQLQWGAIDWSGGCILVAAKHGAIIKRNKDRIVPLQPELRALLEPSKGGIRNAIAGLGNGNLGRAFDDQMTACGLSIDDRSPHSLRHTYAGLMTATGVPTALVGAYMGHSTAQTTMAYTQLAARHVDAAQKWHRGAFQLTAPCAPANRAGG